MPRLFFEGNLIFILNDCYFSIEYGILSLCLLCQKDLFYRRDSLSVGVYIALLANM